MKPNLSDLNRVIFLSFFFSVPLACEEQQNQVDRQSVDLGIMLDQQIDDQMLAQEEMNPIPETLQGHDPLGCDPLQQEYCSLPWPSDYYQDQSEHFRSENDQDDFHSLMFTQDSLPFNRQGQGFDPSIFKQVDGYGLLATGMVYLDQIDSRLDLSLLPNEEEIEQSLSADSPVMLVEWNEENPALSKRVPCWAEIDLRASESGPRVLFLRPAQLLKPNQRYIYALANLKNDEGMLIESSPAFTSLKKGKGHNEEGDQLVSELRRAHFETLFQTLETLQVNREHLTLAWSFKTATERSLTQSLVHMRDQGLDLFDERQTTIEVDEIIRFRQESEPVTQENESWSVNAHFTAELRGRFFVPNFMTADGVSPGEYLLRRDQQGLPISEGWVEAPFWLRVPHQALNRDDVGVILYGHGQLYSGAEIQMRDKGPVAQEGNYIYLATDLWGMSEDELPQIPQILNQMSYFTRIADRLHQGIFNHLVLARIAKQGLREIEWLSEEHIQIQPQRVVYGGISQGGIFGPTILSLCQDIERGHFGVPGLHYFTLIGRSRNFSAMFTLLNYAYPDPIETWISLAAAQLLWNATDPSSYYHHLNLNLFPNTPAHQVLLTPAQGDPQVAQLTVEHLTRSHLNLPFLGTEQEQIPPLAEQASYPHQGSALVTWHFAPRLPLGAGPAPVDHTDPHDIPRNNTLHNQQMLHFWETGEVINLCGNTPCGIAP